MAEKLSTIKKDNTVYLLYGDEIIATLRKKTLSLQPWNYKARAHSNFHPSSDVAFCRRITIFLQENLSQKSRLFVMGDRYGFEDERGVVYSIEATTPEIQIHFRK